MEDGSELNSPEVQRHLNPKSTPSLSVVHGYRVNQPSFSALCCPTTPLVSSSPNSFMVCGSDLKLQTVHSAVFHSRRVLNCWWTTGLQSSLSILLLHQTDNNNTSGVYQNADAKNLGRKRGNKGWAGGKKMRQKPKQRLRRMRDMQLAGFPHVSSGD